MSPTRGSHDKLTAQVIIVGAGPVGLLTALRLGQAGIKTLVIEKHDSLLQTTRAVAYMPVVIPALRQLGILDRVVREAYLNREGVSWRDIEGTVLARLPINNSNTPGLDGVLHLGQRKLNNLIVEELQKHPTVSIHYGLTLTAIDDDAASSSVLLTAHRRMAQDAPDVQFEAAYVLGTDGANSAVRHLLNLDFEGFTYEQFTMIGTDVVYDFAKHNNMCALDFTIHPDQWAVIAYTGQDEDGHAHDMKAGKSSPQWRIAYVEPPGLPNSKEDIWNRAVTRVKTYCRSAPETVKILRAEPYTMQQRCASQAKKGRVMLAGDALHSNNPIGGLGLTGGILDAYCYGNALIRALSLSPSPNLDLNNNVTNTTTTTTCTTTAAADTLLTQCANSRLQTWKSTTDPLSQANMARLYGFDPAINVARDQFFAKLNGEGEGRDTVVASVRDGLKAMISDDFSEGVNDLLQRR